MENFSFRVKVSVGLVKKLRMVGRISVLVKVSVGLC